jgi:hypothetical protein
VQGRAWTCMGACRDFEDWPKEEKSMFVCVRARARAPVRTSVSHPNEHTRTHARTLILAYLRSCLRSSLFHTELKQTRQGFMFSCTPKTHSVLPSTINSVRILVRVVRVEDCMFPPHPPPPHPPRTTPLLPPPHCRSCCCCSSSWLGPSWLSASALQRSEKSQ